MIVQIGPYPPPIGGVSMHIKRMKERLDSNKIQNEVWDTSRVKKNIHNIKNIRANFFFLPFFVMNKRKSIFHYHIPGILIKAYVGFINNIPNIKKNKKIITIHGDCVNLLKKKRKLLVNILNSFDAIICVKNGDKDFLLKNKIKSKIFEIPAFLPPIIDKKEKEKISQNIWRFINNHSPIICANACEIAFYNGEDLYGIDLCIDVCRKLSENYQKIGFVFCLPEIGNYRYLNDLKKRIKKYNISENFIFCHENAEFYTILKKSDLFVRPTNKDGDAVSVREALYFNVQTVVSNAVPRPYGSIIFESRNLNDFFKKVDNAIKNKKENRKSIQVDDNFIKINNIYDELLKDFF